MIFIDKKMIDRRNIIEFLKENDKDFIIDKNIYTCSHENSKSNFEKLIILNYFIRH